MDAIPLRDAVVRRTACILESLRRLTGRAPFEGVSSARERSRLAFEARFVLLAHGVEADPVLDYGNRLALELFEMPWERFVRTPSRLTAEAPEREERARLLDRVTRHGFIDDYSGIRVSATGRRFRIERAVVFNVEDERGEPAGQAAMFEHFTRL